MGIDIDLNTKEVQKFVESASVPNKPVVAIANPDGTDISTGQSTSAKQDQILTELQKKTEPNDIQQIELIDMFRLLLQAIQYPTYIDRSGNQIRTTAVVTSATLAANQDIRTVTNLTNIGSFSADHMQRMNNMAAWAVNVRSLIT